MDWLQTDDSDCSIRLALDLIGEKWTLLIVRDAMRGVRRFDDYAEHVGVSRPILADRLRKLVDAGIFERTEYREPGQRARADYRITRKGWELQTVLIALLQWGDRHLTGPAGGSVTINHRACGAEVVAKVDCPCGATDLAPADLVIRPGPGARRKSQAASAR